VRKIPFLAIPLIVSLFFVGCSSKNVKIEHAVCYMPFGNSSFISIKNFSEYSADILVVTGQDLPVVSSVNRVLLSIEHLVDHPFTEQDWNELLGQDFSLALFPHLLLVTETHPEYNVFYYLKTKQDAVIKKHPYEIRVKNIPALEKNIYYAFVREHLFASDDLGLLKRTIAKKPKSKGYHFPVTSRVVIYDGNKKGPLKVFFSGRKVTLWGETISDLRFKGDMKANSSLLDLNHIIACNLRLMESEGFSKKVYGKLMIRDFTLKDNSFSATYRLMSPLDLKYKRQKKVEEMVLSKLHTASLPLTKRRVTSYLMYANIPEIPAMKDDGVLLRFDLAAASQFPFFSPEFAALLRSAGSINVRKDF